MKVTRENLRLNPKLDVSTGRQFFCKALKPKRTQFLQVTNASQNTEIAQSH